MERRASLAVMLLLTLGPLPLVAWLGEQGIRSLEERHRDLGLHQAASALTEDLASDLERALSDPADARGPLRRASTSFPLRVTATGDDPVAIGPEPSGEEVAHPALMRARALAGEGRDVEALEALEGPMRAPDPALRALGLFEAAEVLAELDRGEDAAELARRAEEAMGGEARGSWKRWTEARALLHSAGVEAALSELESWATALDARHTDVEELVLLGHALRPLDAQSPRVRRIAERLDERRSRPRWRRLLLERLADAAPGRGLLLADTREGWFAVRREGEAAACRVVGLGEWLSEWRGPAGERARRAIPFVPSLEFLPAPLDEVETGRVGPAVDARDLNLEIALAWTPPFGAWNPRLLLLAGLGVYLLLALLALRALRSQERHARRLADARGDLIAEVSHQLRTPLTVLRLYSESLIDERVAPEARGEYLGAIQREAIRLGALVDQVAEAARGEEAAALAESVDPAPVLERVRADFNRLAEADGGSVGLEPGGEPDRLPCGGEELRRILEILVDNAIRYSTPPARVVIGARIDGGRWIASVRDRGPGIPEDERERVFERWVRGESGRAAGSRGAGMGLHLARESARRLGGELRLEFPPEGGTLARLELPRAGEEEGQA